MNQQCVSDSGELATRSSRNSGSIESGLRKRIAFKLNEDRPGAQPDFSPTRSCSTTNAALCLIGADHVGRRPQSTDLGGHEWPAKRECKADIVSPTMSLAGQACLARLAGEVSSDYLVEQVFLVMLSARADRPV
jgi:hypothetical protein